jgi:glycogen(starch) synthase
VWSELYWPYIGGIEVLTAKLIPALRTRGYEFLVLTSHDYLPLPDRDRNGGAEIVRLPFRAALEERDLTALRDVLRGAAAVKREFAPELLHATMLGPSLFFHLRTRSAHEAPMLLSLQNEMLASQFGGDGTLWQEALRSAAWVTGCSERVLDQARGLAPEITKRSSVVRNAADAPAEPVSVPAAGAERLLCLGRLVPAKGLDVALSAFADVAARFPAARLVIAGDGPVRGELEAQAAALGLADAVEFRGWVDPSDVTELLGEATALMMPSRREGLPVAAVQAALAARPIVATRVGGLPELVVNGETGLLVDDDDPRGLADAVAFLFDHPDDAARMGRAARRRALETMSLDRYVDAHDDLYRRLVPTT